MHDTLFANQRFLDARALRVYAESVGLDIGQFDRDVADPAVAACVERHVEAGRASGVRGTPTFFLNGQRQDEWDLPALRMAILAAAGDLAQDTT